jgi:hypothetical protein
MAGLRGKSGASGNQNAFRHGLAGISQRRINGALNPTEQSIREEILAGLLADKRSNFQADVLLRFRRDRRNYNWLNSKRAECGQGRSRTADTRIFSPVMVAELCDTIGRQLNESKPFTAFRVGRFYRFIHIVSYSSGKVVTK